MKLVEAIEAHAAELGTPLLDWQRLAVNRLARFRYGVPAYPDVLISVSRQQGKTILAKAWLAAWADEYPGSNMVYIAQTLMDARDRVIELGDALIAAGVPVKLRLNISKTAIEWPNGSTVWAAAPSERAIHGASLDLVIADEVWSLPERVMGAMIPARGARPGSMLVMISTAGVSGQSVVMERMRGLGHDPESGVGIAEWACPEDVDPFDPDTWESFMPSYREEWFNLRGVQQALETLTGHDFRRYYANQWTDAQEEVIPSDWWEATRLDAIERGRPLVLAFDANEEPPGASIAAAFPHGDRYHLDLVRHRPGDSMLWLIDEVTEVAKRLRPVAICGAGSSVRGIAAEIRDWCEQNAIPYKTATNQDLVGAAVLLADGLRTESITHGTAPALEHAVPRLVRKASENGWKFDKRKSVVDISPVTALSLAYLTGREYASQRSAVFIRGRSRKVPASR